MKYSLSEKDGIVVLSLTGKIMGGPEATEINDKINQLLDEKKNKIVIDLNNVEWMNSSGLGTMMGCMTSLKNSEGELKHSGVTEKVKSLFMITKLITLFETHDTVEEAVDAFK